MENKKLKREFVEVNIKDYLETHELNDAKKIAIKDVKEMMNEIAGTVFSHGHTFCDIGCWLMWLMSVYLDEALKVQKKKELSSEEKEIVKQPYEFKYMVEKYLGYKYKNGTFVANYSSKTHKKQVKNTY